MLKPITVADDLLYTTVKLVMKVGGSVVGTGTGFFFKVPLGGGKMVLLLVSNKHVLTACDEITVMCHVCDPADQATPSGEHAQCQVSISASAIYEHPNPSVDLCAIPFSGIHKQARAAGKPLFYRSIEFKDIPTIDEWDDFDSIEEVTMIGCPRGLSDDANNLPLVRRGITATPMAVPYNGREEFIVDVACFPGSSGSPVFVYNRSGYLSRRENVYNIGGYRLHFVGVLYAGPTIAASGEIVMSQAPQVEVAMMMHLGNVIRSTALLPIIEMAKVRAAGELEDGGALSPIQF